MLSNDDYVRWQNTEKKIRQALVQYRTSKTSLSEYSLNEGVPDDDNRMKGIVDDQMKELSTNRARKELNNGQEDDVSLENLDQVLSICHEVQLNVVGNESNIFELSTYLNSGKTICSLNNIVPTMAYSYLCQHGR
ncbi:unnamed protein product [Rotaria sp. Silwood1]|nr:unnamed protein product [Rotaria sp. Silwood1]